MDRYSKLIFVSVSLLFAGCLSSDKSGNHLRSREVKEALAVVEQFYRGLDQDFADDTYPEIFSGHYLDKMPPDYDAQLTARSAWSFAQSNAWLFAGSPSRKFHPRPIDYFHRAVKSVLYFNIYQENEERRGYAALYIVVSSVVSDKTTPYAAWKDIAFHVEWQHPNKHPTIFFDNCQINGVTLDSFMEDGNTGKWDVGTRLWTRHQF